MSKLKPESIMKSFCLMNPCVEDEAEVVGYIFVPTQEQGGEGLQVRKVYSCKDYNDLFYSVRWMEVDAGRKLYAKLLAQGWKPVAREKFSRWM